ncbi:MAG: hypothetical protein CMO80_15655 [Verrucomicrobiales bacterium]|nr:hypothetical protein [Verrucomicrobiales bacterium]
MNEKWNKYVPAALIIVFLISRIPGLMPLNFSMAYGLAFCAGAFPKLLRWWWLALAVLTSDVLLNHYWGYFTIYDYQMLNYAAYAMIYGIGRLFRKRRAMWQMVGGGLLGAIVFYLVTNTAAWMQNPFYAKNLMGWIQALTTGETGWPQTWMFFRNTLLSGGLFSGLIAAALRSIEPAEPEPEEAEEAEEAGEGEEEKAKA